MGQTTDPIPQADAGPIDDRALCALIQCVQDLEDGNLTTGGAQLILIATRPCLEELADYRRRARDGLELDPPETGELIAFPTQGDT